MSDDAHRVKVLHIAHGTPPGAALGDPLRYVHRLASVQVGMGYDARIVTACPGQTRTEVIDDVPFDCVESALAGPPWLLDDIDAIGALRRILDAVGPDVVHVQSFIGWTPGIVDIAHAHGAACVVTVLDYAGLCARGDLCESGRTACAGPSHAGCGACLSMPVDPMPLHAATVYALSHADLVLVPSERVRALLAREGVDVARIRVEVTGSDTAHDLWREIGQARREEARATLARPDGPLRLIMPGVHGQSAGTLRAIDAIADAQGVNLTLLGPAADATSESLITEAIARSGAPVCWQREVAREHLAAAYAQADVALVIPEWEDPAPQAIAHALGAGIPVIATDIGACPARIRDGENGLLVLPGSAHALRTAIDRFATERVLQPQMVRALHAPHPVSKHAADLVSAYATARRTWREPAVA